MHPETRGRREPVGVQHRPSRTAVAAALAIAAALGGVAACSGGTKKIDASSPGEVTTSTSVDAQPRAEVTTTLKPATGPSTSTTKKPAATSSTIAYFTVPPSTAAQPPDGGGYEPGESVGRKFTDAVVDGKRADATPLAAKAVIDQFEPWKPYSRQNDQGVKVPDYRYTGSTKRGSFNATLAPTVFVHCEVDTGKVVSCSFGE
jgi:hypothetical protein